MDTEHLNPILRVSLLVVLSALTGCGTPGPKNFGGSWKALNRFQPQPIEIPLQSTYLFYAAPMDGTLKTLLTRWADDTGRTLSYRLPFDVTLHTPVADIRTTDLDAAARQLSTIYATQQVHVAVTDQKILAAPSSTLSEPTPDANAVPTSASTAGRH